MGLHIPHNAKCMMPGCIATPRFILSLRMRRPDSGATWAPNQPAYFCDAHANHGSEIFVIFMPTTTGKNHVRVTASGPVVERTTPIR